MFDKFKEFKPVTDPAEISKCFAGGVKAGNLALVRPTSADEVSRIAKIASENSVSIFTAIDEKLNPSASAGKGLILDFSKLNKIEKMDTANLMVHMERGVTFKQLKDEAVAKGVKFMPPAVATSQYPVQNYLNRCIIIAAARFPETQLSNIKVVLADGRIHKTGSHMLGEEASDWRDEPGPHISKWYFGGDDVYGICVRGSALMFPNLESRKAVAYSFKSLGTALATVKEIARLELCQEAVVMNAPYYEGLCGGKAPGEYVALVGMEAFKELAEYQEKNVKSLSEAAGGKLSKEGSEMALVKFDEPWFAQGAECVSYYTLFKDAEASRELALKNCKGANLPELYVAYGTGRAVFSSFHLKGVGDAAGAATKTRLALFEKGVMFDRPGEDISGALYAKTGNYFELMKKIKVTVDPKNILNTGHLF
jgi:hypothetical protein